MEAQINNISHPIFSFIIPVYNRPDEIKELLESFCSQKRLEDIEIIIIEDGSNIDCMTVVEAYLDCLRIVYNKVENGGPSKARNIGARYAKGIYLIFLDSDVVLPSNYLEILWNELIIKKSIDCFGGPDAAKASFTRIQKAINYTMTSFLTTGGIRGGVGKKLDKFFPRSFNLGVKKTYFDKIGGFQEAMRFGEDIDFSLKLSEIGAEIKLLSDAYVFHKRRIDLKKFFKQVFSSGQARMELAIRHKGSLKLVHLLPAIFLLFSVLFFILGFISYYSWLYFIIFALCIFFDSLRLGNSLLVSFWAIFAAFVQLWGYGLGFLIACIRKLGGRDRLKTFDANFYQ